MSTTNQDKDKVALTEAIESVLSLLEKKGKDVHLLTIAVSSAEGSKPSSELTARVSEIIRKKIRISGQRANDMVMREGDTFFILLGDTDQAGAILVYDRIKEFVRSGTGETLNVGIVGGKIYDGEVLLEEGRSALEEARRGTSHLCIELKQ